MQFYHASYWRYVYFRTHIVQQFLRNNISLWVVESDAAWFDDPSTMLLSVQGYDMVAIHDDIKDTGLAIGFVFLNATKHKLPLPYGMLWSNNWMPISRNTNL